MASSVRSPFAQDIVAIDRPVAREWERATFVVTRRSEAGDAIRRRSFRYEPCRVQLCGLRGVRTQAREVSAIARLLRLSGSFTTDDRRAWNLQPQASLQLYDDGGRRYRVGLGG